MITNIQQDCPVGMEDTSQRDQSRPIEQMYHFR